MLNANEMPRGAKFALLTMCVLPGRLQAEDVDAAAKLVAHSAEFRQEVIEVTDGIYVAVGFGLANSILVEGDDGVIIIDTMEGIAAAEAVKAEFDRITNKPVKAIVYTHNHYDHVMGARVFAGDDNPVIFAHETMLAYFQRATQELRGAIFPRSMRQFGLPLPAELRPNAGIGPRLITDGGTGFLRPTETVGDERLSREIAGVRLDLVHAPGETNDQIYVWLPERKVLMSGDNYYNAFPNLYAVRGTPYRDPRLWAESLDRMIAEGPEYLVPSHTRPLSGADTVRQALMDYRDGIRSVYEQTLAGMNQGLTPDELVATVKLPERLAEVEALTEYYGTVAWSVRSIYAGNLGWFDGNPTNLFPLPPRERASRMAELAGGTDALLDRTRDAVAAGDFQWTCELADQLLAIDEHTEEAKRLKARALMALAVRQVSANARNYYMTAARQLDRTVGSDKETSP